MAAPFEPRRAAVQEDPALPPVRRADGPVAAPRVSVHRPPPGFLHPATRAEVQALLREAGEECTYGLRAVHLGAPAHLDGGRLRFGRLIVPGIIVLAAQAAPPWVLPGRLPAAEQERLRRSGAEVSLAGDGAQTVVAWPAGMLRRFVLFDVLLHELGHHVLQHQRRAPARRIVRTRDHEACAERLARRWRERLDPIAGA
jgi:hypothetical protein